MLDVASAPTLPVYSAGDGTWRASAQQAALPAVAVQGVTVLDDLEQEALRGALLAQEQGQDKQQGQQPATNRRQPAAKPQLAGAIAV